jgi:xanthine/uracil permease
MVSEIWTFVSAIVTEAPLMVFGGMAFLYFLAVGISTLRLPRSPRLSEEAYAGSVARALRQAHAADLARRRRQSGS